MNENGTPATRSVNFPVLGLFATGEGARVATEEDLERFLHLQMPDGGVFLYVGDRRTIVRAREVRVHRSLVAALVDIDADESLLAVFGQEVVAIGLMAVVEAAGDREDLPLRKAVDDVAARAKRARDRERVSDWRGLQERAEFGPVFRRLIAADRERDELAVDAILVVPEDFERALPHIVRVATAVPFFLGRASVSQVVSAMRRYEKVVAIAASHRASVPVFQDALDSFAALSGDAAQKVSRHVAEADRALAAREEVAA